MPQNRQMLKHRKSRRRWTYREYIEFSSAHEFRKFNRMQPITSEEIQTLDWKELCRKLAAVPVKNTDIFFTR